MEQKYIYAVYDEFEGFYGNIFVATNDLVAARMFRAAFNPNERSFHLFRIGVYAPVSGSVVSSELVELTPDGEVINNEKQK